MPNRSNYSMTGIPASFSAGHKRGLTRVFEEVQNSAEEVKDG